MGWVGCLITFGSRRTLAGGRDNFSHINTSLPQSQFQPYRSHIKVWHLFVPHQVHSSSSDIQSMFHILSERRENYIHCVKLILLSDISSFIC